MSRSSSGDLYSMILYCRKILPIFFLSFTCFSFLTSTSICIDFFEMRCSGSNSRYFASSPNSICSAASNAGCHWIFSSLVFNPIPPFMIIECCVFFNAQGGFSVVFYISGYAKTSVRSNAPCIELFIKMESPAEPAMNFEVISSTLYQVLNLQTETLLRMITLMNAS